MKFVCGIRCWILPLYQGLITDIFRGESRICELIIVAMSRRLMLFLIFLAEKINLAIKMDIWA